MDYDLFYFDPDLSLAAEDRTIDRLSREFSDLGIRIEPRNQARVHLWYERKFGIKYPPVRSARHAVRRFPTTTTAVALAISDDRKPILYAPFGLSDALNLIVKPNPRLPIRDIYEQKTTRWKMVWPELVVHPWDNGSSSSRETSPNAESVNAP
jgi:hypothetical protein